MDVLCESVLILMRSGLTGQALPLPEGFDLEQVYPELRRHQVLALGYLGAVQCGIDKRLNLMSTLFQEYCRCLQRSESQMSEVKRVCEAFDKVGVDYMPLKGCNVKALYPSPELRTMGDADILIRTEQYDRIRPIMQQLGFTEKLESNHELNWQRGALLLELHKRIIPSYNRDYYRYFGDGWRLATECQGTRYAMSHEDEFIYLFTHFAKHYRDGGIGIRHLLDLHVYLQAYSQLDMTYILQELDKLQLRAFFENISKTVKACFCGEQQDDVTKFITCHIFESGAYGTKTMKKISAVVRQSKQSGSVKKARLSRLFSATFLPYRAMKDKYAILRKVPVLLPVFWVVRAVEVLTSGQGKLRSFTKDFDDVAVEKAQLYQQALNYVGLDFNFKE